MTFPFVTSDSIFADMQRVADSLKKEIESQLKETFNSLEVVEHLASALGDPPGSYRMKVKTDNNGYICIKTIRRDPENDWQFTIEEYEKGGNIPVENGKEEKETSE